MNHESGYSLSSSQENALKDFLGTYYGLHLHRHQEDKFRQAVRTICEKGGFASVSALLLKMRRQPLCEELSWLVRDITVDESYFFRDDEQQAFLRNEFFPELIAKRRRRHDLHLNVWSAGCATGQEIYSIAILLHQLLPDFPRWKLHLVGSDVNHASLEQAIAAEYNDWSIRTDSEFIHQSGYFSTLGNGHYRLEPFIRDSVRFFYLNLADENYPSLLNQTFNLDLILCRNVFIYFTPQMTENCCRRFAQALRPGGVLMLSAADPAVFSCSELEREKYGHSFYFRRKDEEFMDIAPVSEFIVAKPAGFADQEHGAENVLPEVPADEGFAAEFDACKRSIIGFLREGNWHRVVELCDSIQAQCPDNAEIHQFRAKALVNLGLLEEAREACEKSLEHDSLDPHSHLLYGLVLLQLELYNEAEKAFRKTVFLNHDFMEAHYQLGQVLLYQGKRKQGIKSMQNALDLAEDGDKGRPVHNALSLTYGGFAQMLKNELIVLDAGERS